MRESVISTRKGFESLLVTGNASLKDNKEEFMKKFVIALALLSFVSVGCTGSFMLTKKVYNWHRGMGDKWGDEFGFLLCVLVPVYGISTFADAIVFNSIEFWTGNNPVTTAQA